jgi:hypothetical protein
MSQNCAMAPGAVLPSAMAWSIETTIGGTAVADLDSEAYTCRLRCHAANGEVYSVAFTRTSVRVSAYENDSALAAIEAWADCVPALA